MPDGTIAKRNYNLVENWWRSPRYSAEDQRRRLRLEDSSSTAAQDNSRSLTTAGGHACRLAMPPIPLQIGDWFGFQKGTRCKQRKWVGTVSVGS
jgi:hypothetical protein